MYGYIRLYSDELKIKDFNIFKSYYCGLCRELAEQYGSKARLLISYDMAFFALFIDAVSLDNYQSGMFRCPAHWINKRPMVINSVGIKKAAKLTMSMAMNKLKDDWSDDKKVLSFMGMKLFARSYRRNFASDLELSQMIESKLNQFYDAEKIDNISLDELVDPFAKMTGEVLSESAGTNNKLDLYRLGYQCGRWIYFIDALDDLPIDYKTGKFNGYLHTMKGDKSDWLSFYRSIRDDVESNLYFSLGEISDAMNKLSINQHQEILMNIFYLGIRTVTDHILYLRDKGNEEKFSDPYNLSKMFKHNEDKEVFIKS